MALILLTLDYPLDECCLARKVETLVRTASENSVSKGESAARTQVDKEGKLRTDVRTQRKRRNVHLINSREYMLSIFISLKRTISGRKGGACSERDSSRQNRGVRSERKYGLGEGQSDFAQDRNR